MTVAVRVPGPRVRKHSRTAVTGAVADGLAVGCLIAYPAVYYLWLGRLPDEQGVDKAYGAIAAADLVLVGLLVLAVAAGGFAAIMGIISIAREKTTALIGVTMVVVAAICVLAGLALTPHTLWIAYANDWD